MKTKPREMKCCRNCKKFFVKNHYSDYAWERVKYCSITCRVSIKKEKICESCSSPFLKMGDYSIKSWNEKARFCSKECMDKGLSGEKSPHWKGGITQFKRHVRTLGKYLQWRKEVFSKDGSICSQCGDIKGLQIDHIIPMSQILLDENIRTLDEARRCTKLWDINNGRVLCSTCHRKTDTYSQKPLSNATLSPRRNTTIYK